jgi:hypothetical protein
MSRSMPELPKEAKPAVTHITASWDDGSEVVFYPGNLGEATALSREDQIRQETKKALEEHGEAIRKLGALSDHQDRITICSECGEPFYKRENGKIAGFHNHKRGDSVSDGRAKAHVSASASTTQESPQPLAEDRMCENYPDCGLTQWSCNRLQDIVYEDDVTVRRKLGVEIRQDMGKVAQALSSPTSSDRHEEPMPTDELKEGK